MKKSILFFLIIISNILYAAQLITDGQISFYYDEKNQEIKSIKGNQLNSIDITRLDIGIIEDKKYYRLKEFYKEKECDLERLEVRFKGVFKEHDFNLTVRLSEESSDRIEILFNTSYDKPIKVVYGIRFLNQNGIVSKNEKNVYTYENKLHFSDDTATGVLLLSEEKEILEDIYKFVKVETKGYVEGRNSYYISDIIDGRGNLQIKFGNFQNSKVETIRKKFVYSNEEKELQNKQLKQLSILLSRGVIIDRITENIPKISYENETDMKIMGYKNRIITLAELLQKSGDSRAEELYYRYSIYKLILEDSSLLKYKDTVEEKIMEFLDLTYNLTHEVGEIKEVYYTVKIIKLLEKSGIEKYSDKKDTLVKFFNNELFQDKKLKNNRYSKVGNSENMRYMDLLYRDNLNSVIKSEYNENYNSLYNLLLKKNSKKLIDISYNLDFIRLLKVLGDKRAYIMMGKIEEIINKNNGYIPLFYDLSGNNNSEIYGELIIKYLNFYLE